MKAQLRTTLTLAALAVTLPSQQVDGPQAALERAVLIEQQEGDLIAAQKAYEALLQDGGAVPVHDRAALQLGALLWRLGKQDEARPMLERAAQAGGELGKQAERVLSSDSLEQQGKQERIERARLLLQRYQELSARSRNAKGNWDGQTKSKMDNLKTELLSLKQAAATACVEALYKQWPVDIVSISPGPEVANHPFVAFACSTLWQIGTKPARDYLDWVATKAPLGVQRFVAATASSAAPDLLPNLQLFLQVSDPTRELWRSASTGLYFQPLAWSLGCLEHAHPSVQEAGLRALSFKWSRDGLVQPQVTAQHLKRITAAADSEDLRLREAAWSVFGQVLQHGGDNASVPLLEQIRKQPELTPGQSSWPTFTGDNTWLTAAAATATALGPFQPGAANNAQMALVNLVKKHRATWSREALPAATKLIQLGYIADQNAKGWLGRFIRLGSPADHVVLIEQLPRTAQAVSIITRLLQRGPTAEYLPAIEKVLALPTDQEHVRSFRKQRDAVSALLQLAAISGHPNADRVISDYAIDHPEQARATAWILRSVSRLRDSEPVRAALRKLLVAAAQPAVEPYLRTEIFSELVRCGDRSSLPLLSKAYELGLQTRNPNYAQLDPTKPSITRTTYSGQSPWLGSGINFLMQTNQIRRGDQWSSYSDQDLATAWQNLLGGPARELVWRDLLQPTQHFLPVVALHLVAAQLPAKWASTEPAQRQPLERLLHAFHQVQPEHLAANEDLRTALAKLLKNTDVSLAAVAFHQLSPQAAAEFAEIGIAQLRATKHQDWLTALITNKIPLATDDWLAALGAEHNTRLRAVRGIPKDIDPAVLKAVEGLLGDPGNYVRAEACSALYRVLGQDCVPSLLPMLQDPDEKVRERARMILDGLREVQEQRNFWARNSGVEITTASSAAKLIAQAKAGEDKAQRLLAIRSLALLNAPEALPYLIDWSQDADPDVQAEAKKAITKIHERGAGK